MRTLIKQDFDRAFDSCDLIAPPHRATLPFRIGEMVEDPLAMYLSACIPSRSILAGLPGISVRPVQQWAAVGLQLVGRPFGEPALLNAAYAFEQSTAYSNQSPAWR